MKYTNTQILVGILVAVLVVVAVVTLITQAG